MAKQKHQEQTAIFVQVLEYMDGPQAVLLEKTAERKIVAVAIKKDGHKYPFFGSEISLDQWERYRRGFADLRYLFLYPKWKGWYLFDLEPIKNKIVNLTKVTKDEYADQHYVPDSGFFAYDHSEPIKSTETEGQGSSG